jgi:thiol-disulfide isomerase/thioredoxin
MKKTMLAALAALTLAAPAASWAADLKPFDAQEFAKAKAEGKTVALDFHADWCPTCKKLKPALHKVLEKKEFEKTVAFTVDYDTAKDLEQELGVRHQSTVVVFKGDQEMGRATGLSSAGSLTELLRQGL